MAWHLGQAYGQDLRDRVLNSPGSIAEVAVRFGVSRSFVARARSRRRRLGEDAPGPQCSHVPLKLAGLEQALIDHVAAANDQTLAQVCQWVAAEYGVRVGVTTMWKTLGRLGLSLKKNRACGRAATSGRSAGAPGLGQGAARTGPASPGLPG